MGSSSLSPRTGLELMGWIRASKLRKKGEAVYDAKYAGKKGSRKELYGDESEDDDEEMGSGESDQVMDEDEDEDGFEDLEGEEEEEEVVEEVKVKKVKKSSSKSKTSADQDEKAMMKQLKQAASADVDKGRDVKKQLVSTLLLLLPGCD